MLFFISLVIFCILGFHFACESFINKHWNQLPLLYFTLVSFAYVFWTEASSMGLSVSLLFTCLTTLVFIAGFAWVYFYLYNVVKRYRYAGQSYSLFYPPRPAKVFIAIFVGSVLAFYSVIILSATPLASPIQSSSSIIRREEYPLLKVTTSQTESTDGKQIDRTVSYRYLKAGHEALGTVSNPSVFDFLKAEGNSKVVITYLSRDYIDTSVSPPYYIIKGSDTWTEVKFYLNPEDESVSDLVFLGSPT